MADDDGTAGTDNGTGTQGEPGGTGTDNGTGSQDTWTPPTKEEWEAAQSKLHATNKENADRRAELKKLRLQHETDADKAKREAEEAAQSTLKPAFVRVAAKAALLEADAKPDRAAALAKLVEHSKLDVVDGEVSGLDAEVTRLKAEFPEFFRTESGGQQPEQGRPAGRVEVGGRKPQGTPLSPMEQLAAQVAGRTGK